MDGRKACCDLPWDTTEHCFHQERHLKSGILRKKRHFLQLKATSGKPSETGRRKPETARLALGRNRTYETTAVAGLFGKSNKLQSGSRLIWLTSRLPEQKK